MEGFYKLENKRWFFAEKGIMIPNENKMITDKIRLRELGWDYMEEPPKGYLQQLEEDEKERLNGLEILVKN